MTRVSLLSGVHLRDGVADHYDGRLRDRWKQPDEAGQTEVTTMLEREEKQSAMRGKVATGASRGRRGWKAALAAMALALTFSAGAVDAAVESSPIDVNTASAQMLAELPGIGEAKAAAIIAERKRQPFTSVDDLTRVSGIGPSTVEDLRDRVKTGGKH